MRKTLIRISILAALVAAGVVLKLTWLAPAPVPVRVVEVSRGLVESTVSNSKAGTVKARRRAGLSPEVSGSVVELPHKKGEHVKAGDVLVRLDDASARAQLLLAQRALDSSAAQYERACISSDRAHRELERNQKLAEQRIVSADALDSFESAYAVAQATCRASATEVEHARALVAVAETELKKTTLRAPFDAVIAEMDLDLGEWITPSPPMLQVPAPIDLIDPTSLYVSAPMDEVDSARIHVGQAAKVSLDPYPGQSHAGRVVRVAPYILDLEAQNRTVEIEVELDDAAFSAQLLPGTSADVEVVLSKIEDALRVPTSTLIEGSRVLVFDGEKLEGRAIEIGLRNWDFVEVRSGLKAGERVVSSLDRPEVKAGAKAVLDDGTKKP
jgi:HlyD family secretion protein